MRRNKPCSICQPNSTLVHSWQCLMNLKRVPTLSNSAPLPTDEPLEGVDGRHQVAALALARRGETACRGNIRLIDTLRDNHFNKLAGEDIEG